MSVNSLDDCYSLKNLDSVANYWCVKSKLNLLRYVVFHQEVFDYTINDVLFIWVNCGS